MKKALALIACLLIAAAVFADGVGLCGGMGGLTINYKQDNSNITYKVATNFSDVYVGMDMDMAEYPLFTIADLPVKLYWGVGGDAGFEFFSTTFVVQAGAYAGLRLRFMEKWELFAPQLGIKPQLQVRLANEAEPIGFNLFNIVAEGGFRYWF